LKPTPETDPEKIRTAGKSRLQTIPSIQLSRKVIRYSLDDILKTLEALTKIESGLEAKILIVYQLPLS
jgi:hypothetical protein